MGFKKVLTDKNCFAFSTFILTSRKLSNSPLSKRVADWGEGGRAFNYGIVWGRKFSLTQVKFQFNNEQKFKYCVMLKRMKILKQKG